jgi:hypothetical protein
MANMGFSRGVFPYPSQMATAVGRCVVSMQGEGRKIRGAFRGVLSPGQGGPQLNAEAYGWCAACMEVTVARGGRSRASESLSCGPAFTV